jgi:hypothetical protein
MIGAAPAGAGRAIEALVPRCDARTVQSAVVHADPTITYEAILNANLAASAPARGLTALALAPERLRAWLHHEPPPPRAGRESRLRDVLATDGPWTVLVEEPGSQLVLGLLWSPRAGGDKRSAAKWAAFAEPGFAKVAWGFSLAARPGGGTLLVSETRTAANDAATRRRFRVTWAVIAPFAAALRRLVLNAIRVEAEAHSGQVQSRTSAGSSPYSRV